jgi:hypothetical protein
VDTSIQWTLHLGDLQPARRVGVPNKVQKGPWIQQATNSSNSLFVHSHTNCTEAISKDKSPLFPLLSQVFVPPSHTQVISSAGQTCNPHFNKLTVGSCLLELLVIVDQGKPVLDVVVVQPFH